MEKYLKVCLSVAVCFCLFAAPVFARDSGEQKAKEILTKSIAAPQQAFSDAKTIYVKSVQMANLSFKKMPAAPGASGVPADIIDDKTEQEYWKEGNKYRISTYKKNAETHCIFDGKTLTTLSNTAPKKQEEITEKEAKAFEIANTIQNDQRAINPMLTYEFLGTEKTGGYDCNVVQTAIVTKDAKTGKKKEDWKTRYFIDEKTDVAVVIKAEITGLGDSINEVKKIEKIDGKFVPVLIESTMGNMGKTVITYEEVKVNQPIGQEIFDESKVLAKPGKKQGK
ncbi:MAG: outer membrane lipoprotein-sorting protein [Endomicrobium sp.]|jgi:hypothetical protein|nr:outer membrane lipoprotein-sorting protein [Endomicrobium sp.]